MNKTLSTGLIVIAVLVLAGSIFFFGTMYGRAALYGPSVALVPNGNARPFGWNNNTYGPSMMGGNRGYGMGPGMLQRGYGWNNGTNLNITPLTVDQARQAAEKYLQPLNMGGNGWDVTIPANVSSEMPITSEQAIEYAQKYLDVKISGATAATNPTQFYGYYTLDFEKDGKVIGMLSVNGYSAQVFLHTWHETFIEEAE